MLYQQYHFHGGSDLGICLSQQREYFFYTNAVLYAYKIQYSIQKNQNACILPVFYKEFC